MPAQAVPLEPPPDDATPEQAHPLTAEHQRLYAHRRLGHAIDDAADANDAPALRQLLDQYDRAFPGDEFQIETAYRLVLDCLEHPGAGSRIAAQRWLDDHNGSVVKRSIVRHCVDENRPP